MASELIVQTLKGPSSGANANKILLADGHSIEGVGGGKVLQVVSTKFEPVFGFSSSSYTDISASGQSLSASITPSSTTSKIWVVCNIPVVGNDTSSGIAFALKRNGTLIGQGTTGSSVNAIAVVWSNASNHYNGTSFNFLDSPASTSVISYQVATLASSGTTCYINRRNSDTYFGAPSNITILEIAQ